MTHLAVMTHLRLAVIVHVPLGMVGNQRPRGRDMLAEHVHHDRRAEQLRLDQRPAGDAADVRVELIDRARLDGVMPRIVRARCQLVDDDATVLGDEQLDGERASQLEAAGQGQRHLVSGARDLRAHLGGGDRHMQDVVAVVVAHDRERDVILAVAGHENRRLEREIDEPLQDGRWEAAAAVAAGANLLQVAVIAQHMLAVPVVSAGAGLEHARVMQVIDGGVKLLEGVDLTPGCGLDAMPVDEGLLVDAVLGNAQQVGALRGRDQVTHLVDGFGVDVLELIGEHIGLLRQIMDGGLVVVLTDDLKIGHLRGRAVRRRVEYADAEAHVLRAQCHHAAELSAADDADGRSGLQHLHRAMCLLRQAGHWIRPPSP